MKLGLAVKCYKEKISIVKFKYEMQINEIQMKLQLNTLLEVRA